MVCTYWLRHHFGQGLILLLNSKTESKKAPILVVVMGVSGCGKTTFLKIIHAVLSQDESTLISEDVNKIVINYLYQDQDSESIESHEITIGKILFNEEYGPPSIAQKVIKKDYD